MSIEEDHVSLNVSVGQIEYAKRLQKLLCERLGMVLPSEYELAEIVVEQAMFNYIDFLEKHFRSDGKPWEEFYAKYHGVTLVPIRLEDFKEQKKGSLHLLEKEN